MSVEERIRQSLQELQPLHLEVINESHMHSGPPNRETHFRVVIASEQFDDINRVKRHRMVQKPLKPLFNEGLHALAIETQTSTEYAEKHGKSYDSPACEGGSKRG
jgi:BolA protein